MFYLRGEKKTVIVRLRKHPVFQASGWHACTRSNALLQNIRPTISSLRRPRTQRTTSIKRAKTILKLLALPLLRHHRRRQLRPVPVLPIGPAPAPLPRSVPVHRPTAFDPGNATCKPKRAPTTRATRPPGTPGNARRGPGAFPRCVRNDSGDDLLSSDYYYYYFISHALSLERQCGLTPFEYPVNVWSFDIGCTRIPNLNEWFRGKQKFEPNTWRKPELSSNGLRWTTVKIQYTDDVREVIKNRPT